MSKEVAVVRTGIANIGSVLAALQRTNYEPKYVLCYSHCAHSLLQSGGIVVAMCAQHALMLCCDVDSMPCVWSTHMLSYDTQMCAKHTKALEV